MSLQSSEPSTTVVAASSALSLWPPSKSVPYLDLAALVKEKFVSNLAKCLDHKGHLLLDLFTANVPETAWTPESKPLSSRQEGELLNDGLVAPLISSKRKSSSSTLAVANFRFLGVGCIFPLLAPDAKVGTPVPLLDTFQSFS